MLWQFHRQLIRGYCCLLSVSKEAVHQSAKDYWYTAGFVLNSSNSRYLDGDKRLTTDIVYSDGTVVSGIKEVSEMTMGKPFYTDLSGRRVENPTKGVYVKSVRMADGQLKSEKVILP